MDVVGNLEASRDEVYIEVSTKLYAAEGRRPSGGHTYEVVDHNPEVSRR